LFPAIVTTPLKIEPARRTIRVDDAVSASTSLFVVVDAVSNAATSWQLPKDNALL
jgi:hypothetical protein